MNYFDRFEIEKTYDINLSKLENKYLALQVSYHPDIAKNLDDKQKFTNIAIDLNEGYKILKDPYSRAVYMLKLENIDIADSKVNPVPAATLERIWQKSEKLEQITASDELLLFIELLEEDNKVIVSDISDAFMKSDYARAINAVMTMKYWLNLIAQARDKGRNAVN